MVLVDSSVWIDYLSPRVSKIDQKLEELIRPDNQVVITGIIFQEVLQGIKNQRSYLLTQKLLRKLPFLSPNSQTHVKAAEIFRKLISKGKNPSTIDVLIASLAIENRIPLFTLDTGFNLLKAYCGLQLFA